MTNVVPLFQSFEDIHVPAPLRDMPNWLIWRFEQYQNEPKPRKVPYWTDGTIRHGQQGSPTDRSRLTTFAAARDAAARKGYDGVGFAHIEGSGIVTLDFDKCVGPDGKVRQDVLDLVAMTYAEFSPSGKGIHAIFVGDADILGNRKATVTEGPDFSVEAFSSSGFTTFTGNTLDYVDILNGADHLEPLPAITIAECQKRFGLQQTRPDPDDFMAGREPKMGLSVERMQELLSYLDPDMDRGQWIRVGMALHDECEGDDTGFELWDEWSSDGYTYPDTEALRKQWKSFKASTLGKPRVTMRSVMRMVQASGKVDTLEARENLAELLKAGASRLDQASHRFQILSTSAVAALPDPNWLIHGVLPEKSLAMIYGKSGAGKTFAVLDIAAHVALGKNWNGLKTKQGRIVYIAAEGGGGLKKRLKAISLAFDVEIEMLEIGCIIEAPNFLERGDIEAIISRLQDYGPVSVVIADTLAQVTPGCDENLSGDMGLAISNAQRIIREIETSVLLVHHAGKDDSRGARGWSGLRAAMDAEFEVKSRGDLKELRVTKMKDGEEGQVFAFRLEQHNIGLDAGGLPITSCAVRYVDYVAPVAVPRSFGKAQSLILKTREKLDMFNEGISRGDLLDKATATVPAPSDGKKDNRRSNLERTIKGLLEQRHIIERDGLLFEGGG